MRTKRKALEGGDFPVVPTNVIVRVQPRWSTVSHLSVFKPERRKLSKEVKIFFWAHEAVDDAG